MRRNQRLIIRDLILVAATLSLLFFVALSIASRVNRRTRPPSARPLSARLRRFAEGELRRGTIIYDSGPIYDAVDTIITRLSQAPDVEVPNATVLVVKSNLVNAIALPGQLIVIYTGLIENIDGAEELGAIIAHELGHAAHRDPIRQLIRSTGLRALTLLTGGSGGQVLVERIITEAVGLSYARKYELRADEFAISLLENAGLDPAALGRAFEQIGESIDIEASGPMRYLDPHEDVLTRIERSYARSTGAGYESYGIDWEKVRAEIAPVAE